MRVLIAIAAVLSVSLAMALPADGQQRKARKSESYTSRAKKSDYTRRTYEDSADCVRAEALDPAGNYKAYPCWARKAFSPRAVGGP
jgi:hypothetical protein